MDRPRNLMTAAAILAGGLVLAAIIAAGGLWFAIDRAAARFERAVNDHAVAIRDAGQQIGPPVGQSLATLSERVITHGDAIRMAGEMISHPQVKVVDGVPIREPLTIRGADNDGAIQVEATIGK